MHSILTKQRSHTIPTKDFSFYQKSTRKNENYQNKSVKVEVRKAPSNMRHLAKSKKKS